MVFTIVHFRLTRDCIVYAVCTSKVPKEAVKTALNTISSIAGIENIHPVLKVLNDNHNIINIVTECWDSTRFTTRYNGRPFTIYTNCGCFNSYTYNAAGVKTAFGNYVVNILDPYDHGVYSCPPATILVDNAASDYFMSVYAPNFNRYRVRSDDTRPINRKVETGDWRGFNRQQVESEFNRVAEAIKQLDADVQAAKNMRKPETVIESIVDKYKNTLYLYNEAKYNIEGSPLDFELYQMESKIGRIKADITEINTRVQERNNRFTNKAFGNSNDSIGKRLKNLFNWK